jgi:hypothetical protein
MTVLTICSQPETTSDGENDCCSDDGNKTVSLLSSVAFEKWRENMWNLERMTSASILRTCNLNYRRNIVWL